MENEYDEMARCPECFAPVHQEELDIFGGLCEDCYDKLDDEYD